METASRALLGLSLLAVGVIAFALALPDTPDLGARPSPGLIVESVTEPLVLIALGLAMALVFFGGAGPESKPMTATVRSQLPTLPEHATSPTRLSMTRTSIAQAVSASMSGEQLLDVLLEGAARCGASDLHLQPIEGGAEVSYRVDGQLEPIVPLSMPAMHTLINRLKVVARLIHYKSDAPQDGQFSVPFEDGKLDVRLSLLPTQFGEKAVLRLTGLARKQPTLDDLGLPPSSRAQLERFLAKPQGLLFFTGPTGSGKTTSIYGALNHLQAQRQGLAQIATIEDPIELGLPNVAQTQVNRATGLDFAAGLRAILRQDPNIIVVGEIRDAETASIAMQAGLTGHLILTTVHADSAAGVFNRLLEMGVEPSVVASVSLACISQRLVRKLCPHCRTKHTATEEEAKRLGAAGISTRAFFSRGGCGECGGTGAVGRHPVFEILEMSQPLRDALRNAPTTQALMQVAVSEGTVPLLKQAVALAAEGITTLDEAFRVAG